MTLLRAQLYRFRHSIAFLFVAFNWLDLALTRAVINAGGAEGNPLMAPHVETWQGVAFKLTLPLLVAIFALRLINRGSAVTLYSLYGVMWVYAVICLWNGLVLSCL
jgi:hypothetical protein